MKILNNRIINNLIDNRGQELTEMDCSMNRLYPFTYTYPTNGYHYDQIMFTNLRR